MKSFSAGKKVSNFCQQWKRRDSFSPWPIKWDPQSESVHCNSNDFKLSKVMKLNIIVHGDELTPLAKMSEVSTVPLSGERLPLLFLKPTQEVIVKYTQFLLFIKVSHFKVMYCSVHGWPAEIYSEPGHYPIMKPTRKCQKLQFLEWTGSKSCQSPKTPFENAQRYSRNKHFYTRVQNTVSVSRFIFLDWCLVENF